MIIKIGQHACEQAKERGTDEAEIIDVLSTGFPVPAKYGRMANLDYS